ncbi:MAG: hypothetical protein HKO76_11765 [Acidimicrobiia bacterium]|nr:hypothetical protein [Acidimicrobiia bacterium]
MRVEPSIRFITSPELKHRGDKPLHKKKENKEIRETMYKTRATGHLLCEGIAYASLATQEAAGLYRSLQRRMCAA